MDNDRQYKKEVILSPAKHKMKELTEANRKDAFSPRLSQCLSANFSLRRFRLTLLENGISGIFAIDSMSNAELKDRTGMKEEHCLLMRDTLTRAREREKVQEVERRLKAEEARAKREEEREEEEERERARARKRKKQLLAANNPSSF